MTTQQVAQRLVELCREGKNYQAVEELYHSEIVTVEPFGDATAPAEQQGIAAVRAKMKWWETTFEVNSAEVSDPLVCPGYFAVKFDYQVTSRGDGQRVQVVELAVYQERDGKIIREEFFYDRAVG